MDLLFFVMFVVLGLAVAGIAATLGVDSREGSDDPHRSSYPVGIG